MTQPPKRPDPPSKSNSPIKSHNRDNSGRRYNDTQANTEHPSSKDIDDLMVDKINKFNGLQDYKTRDLVEDTEKLGEKLVKKGLKTTQIRKFLDAVNQLKAKIGANKTPTEEIKSELPMLRAKLAYAAAKQRKDKDPGPVEPLRKVLDAAIKKACEKEDILMNDFTRLSQLIESIVAYHKAAGGKDQ